MGQKVNPRGFRIGLNSLWSNESQCYGKRFKNSKLLAKKIGSTSNFLNNYFESKMLIKGQLETEICANNWKCNVQYVPLLPKDNQNIDSVSKKMSSLFSINIELKRYNTILWYQNGLLICEFIKVSLKKGLAFRKITSIIQTLLLKNPKHHIVLKTPTGIKHLEFSGLKIKYAGRFGGSRSRMATSLVYRMGAVSLQKLETYIEFHETPLYTKQGVCNLQVWMSYKTI